MEIADRLRQIIDYLRIRPNAFALKIGISQPRMSNYLKGRLPDYDTLHRICTTFVMINPTWLLTGEGEMLKSETPKIEENSGAVSDLEPSKIISELTEVIRTQAKALLEQQQFISAHFPSNARGAVPPPLQKGDQYAEKQ